MNDLRHHLESFAEFEPFAGFVPKGFMVDSLGTMTDATFRAMWDIDPEAMGGHESTTAKPDITWGEGFFEFLSWFDSAREARGTYTMITLGACYGSQAVGAYRALQKVNPMPARLVAVEAEPKNFEWVKKHFRDNGIDPDEHWLINSALSDTNKPVLFPIGEAGSGVNNCIATNNETSRRIYASQIAAYPNLPEIVETIIREGKTGIEVVPVPGEKFRTHVEFVSAVTLRDILGPLDRVDLLESDIQQSEIVVFPPAMAMVAAKVRRVHIGTHGLVVHEELLRQFVEHGFDLVVDLKPNTHHETEWGAFDINDGIIIATNRTLAH